jgi:hypothetical protein
MIYLQNKIYYLGDIGNLSALIRQTSRFDTMPQPQFYTRIFDNC